MALSIYINMTYILIEAVLIESIISNRRETPTTINWIEEGKDGAGRRCREGGLNEDQR
ncbi:hypothetical protein GCM10007981_04110 [Thermocladium modestius]|uniref:Uncharacterized protein n=1 Tax=Thermocladium modestius TaxID=62609 RepID=A0A830GSD2_9CREN|nr:hypothetical protein GCM10007981_04110 [Thermocladium modestius]